MSERPDWLLRSLGRAVKRRYPWPEEVEWPLRVEAGEIRAARPMDGDRNTRLVLLLESYKDPDPWVNAVLITNEIELATDRDIQLSPAETGLSFPILVETDIVGPLFVVQLGPRLVSLPEELLEQLRNAVRGAEVDRERSRRGIPVVTRRDPRWKVKEQELAAMHALAGDCLSALLEEEGVETKRILVDPAFFTEPEEDSEQCVRMLLQLAGLQERSASSLDVAPEALLGEQRQLASWLSQLPPDHWNALESLWQQGLKTPLPEVSGEGRAVAWHPRREGPASSLLTSYVAAHAARGKRSVRVVTDPSWWQVTDPHSLGTGVAAVDVEGVGRVQVTPDVMEKFLEAAA